MADPATPATNATTNPTGSGHRTLRKVGVASSALSAFESGATAGARHV